ncbi:MAG: hypothetical protein IPQ25_05990 [Chitinophagaceae bacterium]|nr:hypothetical protein [Chitinophagaceae bacterium]
MKKIFTLVTGLMIAAVVMAAGHKPIVSLNNSKNYKVVIDGKTFFGSDMNIRLASFHKGMHHIKVYEMKRGFFGRTERLIDSETFLLGRRDVRIVIDRFGNINIREVKANRRIGKDYRYDRDWDDDGPIRRF